MPVPVFRYEDTQGQGPSRLPAEKPSSPHGGRREVWHEGPVREAGPGVYGATDHTNKTILLATEDHDVFFHELAHAIHRTFEPKTGHGQEPEAETIAQLVAATLARLYGRPADNFSWNYMRVTKASATAR